MTQTVLRVIVAIALLAVLTVTVAALRESDRWRRPGRNSKVQANDPYDGLARLLAQGPPAPALAIRDPFRAANVRIITAPTGRITILPPRPVQPQPVVTAIIVSDDANSQAVIRYEGRSITVGPGGLFADYKVISVTADAVVVERAGRQMVLQRPKKGE